MAQHDRPRRRLLFLCHRIPYPPQKGEKIRAWHILDHLAANWDVELGCLVDDPADLEYLPVLRGRCSAVRAAPVRRFRQAARALATVRPGKPLTVGWFHEPGLRAWARKGLAEGRYGAVFAYSSAMAPYAMGRAGAASRDGAPPPSQPRRILDMVDVDSEKWLAYAAEAGSGVMKHVWAREARTLLAFERRAAMAFDRTLFVSEEERRRFVELAPECADRADWMDNGVDLRHFDPGGRHADPYAGRDAAPALVFTGTMDYRPNVDAVCWFAREVLPRLRDGGGGGAGRRKPPEFHIVGANPAPAVLALAAMPGVFVTGRVADTRPYIAHAAVAVAPLRIARGIQNKVLEAMAMARPVVASPQAFEGVRARPGHDLLVAADAPETAAAIQEVLDGKHPGLGQAGRAAVAAAYDWKATLRRLDAMIEPGAAAAAPVATLAALPPVPAAAAAVA